MTFQYPAIGKDFTGTSQMKERFPAAVSKLEWTTEKTLPFSQGYALNAIIKEWSMKPVSVSYNGVIESAKKEEGRHITCALLGVRVKVEGGFQEVYFADDGLKVTPIALTDVHE